MFRQIISVPIFITAAATLGMASLTAQAADTPTAATSAQQSDPAEYDRDGKHICGYDLMSDSERAGHRSMLHATKSLEDRDAIRKDLCERMRKRAQEKGVPFKE